MLSFDAIRCRNWSEWAVNGSACGPFSHPPFSFLGVLFCCRQKINRFVLIKKGLYNILCIAEFLQMIVLLPEDKLALYY
jgi:hypothetical protein